MSLKGILPSGFQLFMTIFEGAVTMKSGLQCTIPIGQYLGKTQSIYGLDFHKEIRKCHHVVSY